MNLKSVRNYFLSAAVYLLFKKMHTHVVPSIHVLHCELGMF